jgi:hypothetical protein
MEDIRIINEKGEVQYVTPAIANNERLLAKYGWRKEHLGETTNSQRDLENNEEGGDHIVTNESIDEKVLREEYFNVFGKKPGNKSIATMIKEIEEHKTAIQNGN